MEAVIAQSEVVPNSVIRNFLKTSTIRYLGNKRKMIDIICTKISEKVEPGDTVIDLFAGTNCIAYALKSRYLVYTNDIQKYSYVIAKALMENNSISISKEVAKRDLYEHYRDNLEYLEKLFRVPLKKEKIFFNNGRVNWIEYKNFSERYPRYSSKNSNVNGSKFRRIFSEENISKYREEPTTFPSILFSTYFSNSYFGIRQSLEIDSIRYAIDRLDNEKKDKKKYIYLTALIYAISSAVNSTGHFAQYRNINSEKNCKEIINERSKTIMDLFLDKIDKLFTNPIFAHFQNKAFNQDYSILLNSNKKIFDNDISLVYVDPPYTSDHYSRYYHVLETLVKYDYPTSFGKGRYRNDRHHSNFSKSKCVVLEFNALIKDIAKLDSKMLLSYTDAGLISSNAVIDLCKKYYKRVSLDSIEYNHSNQGRSMTECKKRKVKRKEYLIYCEFPRKGV